MSVLEVMPENAHVVLAAEAIMDAEATRLGFDDAVANIDEAHATLSEAEIADIQATRAIKTNGSSDTDMKGREFR